MEIQCCSRVKISRRQTKAPFVQRIASAACDDGLSHPDVQALARLGTNGKFPGNTRVELIRLLQRQSVNRLSVATIGIVMRIRKGMAIGVCVAQQGFVFPHLLLHHIYANCPSVWAKRVRGVAGKQQEFWDGVPRDDPRRVRSPWFRRNIREKGIPLAFHADGVPCTKGESLEVYSVHSLLGEGNSLQVKFLLTALFKSVIARGDTPATDTMGKVWNVILWCLRILESGVFPNVDWAERPYLPGTWEHSQAGLPFAGGYWFPLWLIKGDMEWMANSLGLPHWQSAKPCAWCQCSREPDNGVFNFFPAAQWRRSLWLNARAWKRSQAKLHPIFQLDNVSLFSIGLDMLHTVDLGVVQHAAGSVLMYMVTSDILPCDANMSARISFLWDKIHAWYSTNRYWGKKSTINSLKLGMFGDQRSPAAHFAFLRGCKAAESRHLVPALHAVFREFCRRGTYPEIHILELLKLLCKLYENTERDLGFYLSPEQVANVRDAVENLLLQYNLLTQWAIESGRKLFNLVPKHHYVWHLAYFSQYSNPAYAATFLDEDYVGRISNAAHSCTMATPLTKVPLKLCQNYCAGMHLQWQEEERGGGGGGGGRG